MAKAVLYQIEPEQARVGGFTDHDVDRSEAPGCRAQGAPRRALRLRQAPRAARGAQTSADDGRQEGKSRAPARRAPFEGTPRFEQHEFSSASWSERTTRQGRSTFASARSSERSSSPTSSATIRRELAPSSVRAARRARAREPPRARCHRHRSAGAAGTPVRMHRSASSPGPEGAFVAVDVRTRQILALVGSYEGQAGALDRATQSRRQPGSTFKPIVYSYALHSRRFTPATLVDPNPDVFEGGYHPSNFEGWPGHDPLRLARGAGEQRERRRGARATRRGAGQRRRVGAVRSASTRR